MKKTFILLLVVTFFNSCKEETKKVDQSIEKVEVNVPIEDEIDLSDGRYRIVFEGVFEEDDMLLIFYTTEANKALTTEKSIRKNIKGSVDAQKIVLTFEKNIKPYNIRIDFSDNKNQKQVKLNALTLIDNYNKIIINSNNLENYFALNNYMIHNKPENLLIGKTINEGYNPYFVANKQLLEILNSFNEASLNKTTTDLIDDAYNVDFNDGRQRIIITGTFKSDDLLLMFYTEDSLQKFETENSIRKTIKGSNQTQKIILTLPGYIMATKLKLDISDRKNQEGIDIESLIIKMDDSEIVMDKTNFHEYFHANNYIDYNKVDGTFKCKTIKEGNIEKYNPYFISSAKLVEDLKYI